MWAIVLMVATISTVGGGGGHSAARSFDAAMRGCRPARTVIPLSPSAVFPAATTFLPDGVLLVAFAPLGPSMTREAPIYAFTSTCAPDETFGSQGVARLRMGGRPFAVTAMTPSAREQKCASAVSRARHRADVHSCTPD